MGMILYIGNSEKIADNIENIQTSNHRVAVLNLKYNYKYFIEEYMPDYILLSEDIDGFEEISEYITNNTASNLIITGNKGKNTGVIRGALRTGCPGDQEGLRRIIDTIDRVDPGKKCDKGDYKFLKQEVISFYSVQGGAGKTSLVFNTAWRLTKRGMAKVLIVDLNFCEGPSDLCSGINMGSGSDIGDFMEDMLSGEADISKNVIDFEGIDILYPPLSLQRSDRFSVDMLDALIYSARKEYDLIITDLPFRYDNISLEMINISTTSVLVMTSDMKTIPRIKAFRKFLPESQKKMAVLNRVESVYPFMTDELEEVTGLSVCAIIPFITESQRYYLAGERESGGIIDIQADIDNLINRFA